MWNLPLPDDSNSIEELTTALTYKTGVPKYSLLEGEVEIIQELYSLYHLQKGAPCRELLGVGLSDASKDALKNAYSEVQNSGRLSNLRSRLFLSAKKCPLCGIEAVTDLDHYLPESKYKGLAIYSRNLIPTCHKCNNKKRAAVGVNGVGFLHLYYFEEPNDVFFVCDTDIVDGALSMIFKVIQVEGMIDEIYQSLIFQTNRINLDERLNAEANDLLGSMYTSFFLTYQSSGIGGLQNLLEQTAIDYRKRFGLNHWKSALLDSLSKNQSFINSGFISALGRTG